SLLLLPAPRSSDLIATLCHCLPHITFSVQLMQEIFAPDNLLFARQKYFSLHTTHDSLQQRNFRSIQPAIRSNKEISAPFNPRFAPTKHFPLHTTHDSLHSRNFRSIPAFLSHSDSHYLSHKRLIR